MKRIHLTLGLLLTSLTLILLQSVIIQFLVSNQGHSTLQDEPREDAVWNVVEEVATAAALQKLFLFVIDPAILKHMQKDVAVVDGETSCRILCAGQNVTHFGTLGHMSSATQKEDFVSRLNASGFVVIQTAGYDPTLLRHNFKVQISLHYFIYGKRHAVHVVVFYERPGKYWWHERFDVPAEQTQTLRSMGVNSGFLFGTTAGAFEKTEIYPAMVDGIKLFLPAMPTFMSSPDETHFVECNYTRMRLFYDKYGKDESEEADLFRTKALKLLQKAKSILDHLGVTFWLSSGTCLGYFRQCDFIVHSRDVDIGIKIEDYHPGIVPSFSAHGLPLTHLFGKLEDSFELSFRNDDIKLDVFFFYDEPEYMWNGGTQARTGNKFKYIFRKFQLCWTDFMELKVRVPCQTEEYIRANYGDDWFKPTELWDWKKSPPNVENNGQWPVEEWPEVIQLYPLPEQN